jgi:RNase P/RNase MRP subunit p29
MLPVGKVDATAPQGSSTSVAVVNVLTERHPMKLTLLAMTVCLASVAVAPAPSLAAARKPKPPVYELSGGYTRESVVYTHCKAVGGGFVGNTTRVVRTFAYSGDTRSGVTVVETEQTFAIQDVEDNEFVLPDSIAGQKRETTRKVKGGEVVTAKGKTGSFFYEGIGNGYARQTFKLPAKGKARAIKIDSFTRANDPAPGAGCDVSYDQTEAKGTIQVRLRSR